MVDINLVSMVKLDNIIFVDSKDYAYSRFIERTLSKAGKGRAWGASFEIDDKEYYAVVLSETKPSAIETGEDTAPVNFYSLTNGFQSQENGTMRKESLVPDETTPAIYLKK